MDEITPFVGILGAVVGGAIGLLGQRLNIREQRRKELRERVVDFLVEAAQLYKFASSLPSPMPDFKTEEGAKVWDDLEARLWILRKANQHLELVSPRKLRVRVGRMSDAIFPLCNYYTLSPEQRPKGVFLARHTAYHEAERDLLDFFRTSYYRLPRHSD